MESKLLPVFEIRLRLLQQIDLLLGIHLLQLRLHVAGFAQRLPSRSEAPLVVALLQFELHPHLNFLHQHHYKQLHLK